jgi:hypothetical protein
VAAVALAAVVGAQSNEGVEQVERLVKASGNTVNAIAVASLKPEAARPNQKAAALRPQ